MFLRKPTNDIFTVGAFKLCYTSGLTYKIVGGVALNTAHGKGMDPCRVLRDRIMSLSQIYLDLTQCKFKILM